MNSPRSSLTSRPLWTCPKCGRPFINANMPHSCGRYSVRTFLAGKSKQAISLYEHFSALVRDCGPVQVAPAKTRIGFQVRMIFAAVNKLSDHGLEAHVVLTRRLGSPRFRRIETLTPKCHVHHFRIESLSELDEEVKSWLRAAYQVGTQEHLSRQQRHVDAPIQNQSLISEGAQAMSAKPQTIDEYLAPLSSEKRAALEKLRKAIKSAAPRAEECISYQIPTFRLGGRMLVSFGAWANHCAFYPGSYPLEAHKKELKAYDTSKGSLRFPADSPLPAALVRKLVKARIAQQAKQAVAAQRAGRRR